METGYRKNFGTGIRILAGSLSLLCGFGTTMNVITGKWAMAVSGLTFFILFFRIAMWGRVFPSDKAD